MICSLVELKLEYLRISCWYSFSSFLFLYSLTAQGDLSLLQRHIVRLVVIRHFPRALWWCLITILRFLPVTIE